MLSRMVNYGFRQAAKQAASAVKSTAATAKQKAIHRRPRIRKGK